MNFVYNILTLPLRAINAVGSFIGDVIHWPETDVERRQRHEDERLW